MNTLALDLQKSSETHYLTFRHGDPRYDAVLEQYFRLRKKVFVDDLKWELNHPGGLEIDQYDRDDAEYVLAMRSGECVGGCRMASTTTEFEFEGRPHSYMLRDAALGRLDGFPVTATHYAPVNPDVWELTRVISGKSPVELRNLLWHARTRLMTKGVSECIFITRPVVTKVSKAWGYEMEITGPTLDFGTMRAVAVRCNIRDLRMRKRAR